MVKNTMKKLLFLLFITLLFGCSSTYEPSSNTLSIKKNMTSEQAILVLQNAIWGTSDPKGACGSRGFWYDEESNMKVFKDKIVILAHERGKQLRKINQGFDAVVVFEKQYYMYDFEFDKINKIHIYDTPELLPVFPVCNIKDLAKDYLIIDLYDNKLSNLKFTVLKENFDETMAALLVIFSNTPIQFN